MARKSRNGKKPRSERGEFTSLGASKGLYEVALYNGIYYFCVNSLKKVIDEDGKTIVDFSNEKGVGGIDSELLTKILKDKLHLTIQKEEDYWDSIHYYDYDEEFED